MKPAVVILAGGEGRRMGGDKPLRRLGGLSLLDRAVACARSWSDEIAISARSPDQFCGAGLPILLDPPEIGGPLAGLASALQVGRPTVLTIPCDTPFLPEDLPDRLARAMGERAAALPASLGRVHPVCGLWRTDLHIRLQSYAGAGRRSLIGFAESVGYGVAEWPGDPFFNINSPDDLAEAERRLEAS
jgi:molybdopterin-guanine dinucleotide biosynthesis protein A